MRSADASPITIPAATPLIIRSIYIGGVLTDIPEGTQAPAPFRVVYENNEIHPLNHFSVKAAADVVNFFYTAFGTPAGAKYIKSTNETWWIKEAFSFIGLIAIIFCIFPAAGLLLELPCFRSLKRDESLPLAKREVKGVIGWILYLVPAIACTLFSGFSIMKALWLQSRRYGGFIPSILIFSRRFLCEMRSGRQSSQMSGLRCMRMGFRAMSKCGYRSNILSSVQAKQESVKLFLF